MWEGEDAGIQRQGYKEADTMIQRYKDTFAAKLL